MATFKTALADTTTQLTQGGVMYGSTTSAMASTATGTTGQFLKSNGTSAPTWATINASTIDFKNKATYALMIADGTPTITTIYSITNDENKSYIRSTYIWKNDGNREWIASTPDN